MRHQGSTVSQRKNSTNHWCFSVKTCLLIFPFTNFTARKLFLNGDTYYLQIVTNIWGRLCFEDIPIQLLNKCGKIRSVLLTKFMLENISFFFFFGSHLWMAIWYKASLIWISLKVLNETVQNWKHSASRFIAFLMNRLLKS